MDFFRHFLVMLYWDGNVRYVNGSIQYDDNTKMSSIVVTQRWCYEDFLNICYNTLPFSRENCRFSLSLLYEFQGMECVSEISNDHSLNTLYYLASRDEQYCGHMVIKYETVYHVQTPPFVHHFQTFSVGPSDVGNFDYSQHGYNPNYQQMTTFMPVAPASIYGQETTPASIYRQDQPNMDNVPLERTSELERGASVAGFGDVPDDSSSDHSEEDEDSSPRVDDVDDDDDDDSDGLQEGYVPATNVGNQAAMVTTLHQQPVEQELPEWADDEEVDMWCATSQVIRCGMCFKSKKELDNAVRLWNVARSREIIIIESKPTRYKATCYSKHKASNSQSAEPECHWLVYASKKANTQLWQIYKWMDEHTCWTTMVLNNNRSLKSKVIASHISHFIRQDVAYPIKHVQAHIKNVLNVDVSYQKAWHGRKKAIEGFFGSWESNFEELPRYITELERSNPNTIVRWKHHDTEEDTFKYVFWAFGPAIKAWKHCHPVVCVDGTHLKGSYKGKLLTAVTKDANNHVLPLAYAIVDEETNESWSWFLQMFRGYVATNTSKPLCVISDRHKGIIHAMETLEDWKEPHAYHRFCLRHVRSNLMNKFKTFRLKKLCWVMGKTMQKTKYKLNLREMKNINQEAWNYLRDIGTSKWTLLYDKDHHRWGNLTTNIAESMNNALKVARLLPIRACIDHIFNKTVEKFRKNSEIAMNCNTPLPPKMWRLFTIRERHAQEHQITEFNATEQTYRVVSKLTTNERGGNDYTVKYKKHKCSCGKWQMTRFPCSHAIAVCRQRGEDVQAIVHKVYKTSTYRRQYRCDFLPLKDKREWTDPGWTLRADSSRIIKSRGRRRARRIQNEMDMHYPEETRIRRCTICKQQGHNRTRCPNSQPSFD